VSFEDGVVVVGDPPGPVGHLDEAKLASMDGQMVMQKALNLPPPPVERNESKRVLF
jgi:hypothetical protein